MKRFISLLLFTFCLGFFNLQAQIDTTCYHNNVWLTFSTSEGADEMSWELINDSGDIVAEGSGYQDNSFYILDYCIEDGCYTLNLYDSAGNGWEGVQLALSDGNSWITFPFFPTGYEVSYPFGINNPDCGSPFDIPGCTDITALNYNPIATTDDGSCVYQNDTIFGCTDPIALNYNPLANANDGSCEYSNDSTFCVEGWIEGAPAGTIVEIIADSAFYQVETNADGYFNFTGVDLSNSFVIVEFNNCAGNTVTLFSWNLPPGPCINFSGVWCEQIFGCTDELAINYNPDATIEDGSCIYPQDSCDFNLVNFNMVTNAYPEEVSWQILDDNNNLVYNSIPYPDSNSDYIEFVCLEDGCYTLEAFDSFGDGWNGATLSAFQNNGNTLFSYNMSSGEFDSFTFGINDSCGVQITGCTDLIALNYNPIAIIDDGSCIYQTDTIFGCTDPFAINYNPIANSDDGSCEYAIDSTFCVEGWLTGAPDGMEVLIYTTQNVYTVTTFQDGMFYIDIPEAPDFGQTVYVEFTDCYGNIVGIDAFSVFGGCYFVDYVWCNQIFGCTDSLAINFNPWATIDDGSCYYGNDSTFCVEGWLTGAPDGMDVFIFTTQNVYTATTFQDGMFYIDIPETPDFDQPIFIEFTDCNGDIVVLDAFSFFGECYFVDYVWCNQIFGCTDSLAVNFNPLATIDDGSCYYGNDSTFCVEGWLTGAPDGMEVLIYTTQNVYTATTFQDGMFYIDIPEILDFGQTVYIEFADCFGNQVGIDAYYNFGSCYFVDYLWCNEVYGCTDPLASNYNPWATTDDGSCTYPCDSTLVPVQLYVCTFSNGNEVGFSLTDSNGNAVFYQDGFNNQEIAYFDLCLDPEECHTATMWNNEGPFGWYGGYFWVNGNNGIQYATGSLDVGQQEALIDFSIFGNCSDVWGCTDPFALNYNPLATIDDGSCIYDTLVVNDLCDNASPLYPGTILISNVGAYQNEGMDGDCWGFGNGEAEQTSIWYEFTTPAEESAVNIVSSSDGSFTLTDTQFGIYEECGEDMIYCDGNSGDGLFAALYLGCGDLEPNTTYLLQIDGWAADEGTCFLSLDYVPCDTAVYGCTDPLAINYNPEASVDDGSCIYESFCEAYFEVEYVDTLNGVVYIANLSSGNGLGYFWDFGDGGTSNDEYPVHEYDDEGTYMICLTVYSTLDSGLFCEDTFCDTISYYSQGFLPGSFWINVIPEGTVGIEDEIISDVNLFPNPANDILNVEFYASQTLTHTFEILDISGRLLANDQFVPSAGYLRRTIDLSNFERGTYLLRIRAGNFANTTRFTVNR